MTVPYIFATQTGVLQLSELDQNFEYLDNLVPPLALTAGTVTESTQANITAIGTLESLSCTGTITTGTLTADIINGVLSDSSQTNITEIGILSNLTVTGEVLAGTITGTQITGVAINGTINTPNQPGITSIGTLGNLNVGNISASGNIVAVTNVSASGYISATGGVSSANLTGTLLTASQPNITAVGTLSNLNSGAISSSGNVTGANFITVGVVTATGTVTGANFITAGVVTATGNVTGKNFLTTGLISATSTVTSAANITASNFLTTGLISGGNLSISGASTLSGVVTAPTAANGTSNTQVATTSFVQSAVVNGLPSGVIVMWSGSIASVPSGWYLCDGSNGTPDLRDRFIVGAGSTYTPGNTGGSANAIVVSHTHTASSVVTDPGHFHTYTAPSGSDTGGAFGSSVVDTTVSANTDSAATGITVATTVNSTGSSGTNANLPPYYALAYIMKA